MKINIKMPRDVPFKELNIGSLFYVYDGAYIKIDYVMDEDGVDGFNAVSLRNGSLEYVDDDKLIQKLDGELNVSFLTEKKGFELCR